jgi:putative transposase
MAMHYRSNRHVVYACTYHVVWCPKYRRALLTGAVELRLKELVQQAVAETTAEIIEMEVMPDHVHLLVSVDPQYGVHRLVKRIKGLSSRVLRTEFPSLKSRLPTLWTHSYFVATCGGAPLSVIKQYIEQQKDV